MGTIQSAINQTLGVMAIGAGIAKKAKDKKEKINEKQIKKESKSDTPELTPEEKWLNSLDPDSRKIIDSLGPKARQSVFEQAGVYDSKREDANAKAMARVESRRKQKDNYSKFMAELTGRDERRFERGDNADNN